MPEEVVGPCLEASKYLLYKIARSSGFTAPTGVEQNISPQDKKGSKKGKPMADFLLGENYTIVIAMMGVLATITGVMVTILIGVFGSLYTQKKIKEREREEAHREKKTEMYSGFFDLVSRMMVEQNPNIESAGVSEDEIVRFIIELKKNIVLSGSDKVIKALSDYEKTTSELDKNTKRKTKKILFSVDKLYRAMRDDVGLSNEKLKRGDLIRLHLKDPKEL